MIIIMLNYLVIIKFKYIEVYLKTYQRKYVGCFGIVSQHSLLIVNAKRVSYKIIENGSECEFANGILFIFIIITGPKWIKIDKPIFYTCNKSHYIHTCFSIISNNKSLSH